MAKAIVCTIVTPDYLHRAIALGLSLRRAGSSLNVIAAVIGSTNSFSIGNVSFIGINEITAVVEQAEACLQAYRHDIDCLRWSLKPSILRYVLQEAGYDEAVYVDPDCCFFHPPDELIAALSDSGIVLTPHWRPLSPLGSTLRFRVNFLEGLFNAGCVGATLKGVDALTWWGEACLSACRKSREEGLYDDQKYLDLIPIYFENTCILRHRGYNLAEWNVHLRRSSGDAPRDVPDRWPVRLVHFTNGTEYTITLGDDPVLVPYLDQYRTLLDESKTILAGEFIATNGLGGARRAAIDTGRSARRLSQKVGWVRNLRKRITDLFGPSER